MGRAILRRSHGDAMKVERSVHAISTSNNALASHIGDRSGAPQRPAVAPSNNTLSSPIGDRSAAPQRPSMAPWEKRAHPWVIIATTNNAFLDFTENWLESLKRCGIRDHVTIIAEDEIAHDILKSRTDMTLDVRLTSVAKSPTHLLQFGSGDYLKLVNKRPAYILPFLEQGVDVLFSDVDTVWLQNPLPHFPEGFDVHFERDIYDDAKKPDMICAGFVYYSATNATINLIRQWMIRIKTKPDIPDQQLLNQLIRNKNIRRTLKINFLDQGKFPNGNDFFNEDWRLKNAHIQTVVVHNNWIKGHDIKIERFKNVSMWYL